MSAEEMVTAGPGGRTQLTRVRRGNAGARAVGEVPRGGGKAVTKAQRGLRKRVFEAQPVPLTKNRDFALVREILPGKDPAPRMRQETRQAASKWMEGHSIVWGKVLGEESS